jgi:outer membrane protein assembly factor BamB
VKRVLIAVGVVILLAGGALAGAYVWNERQTEDVRGSAETEFETTEEPGATTREEEVVREEPWPTYGFDIARTRYARDFDHRPPYRRLWNVSAGRLVEFPPVIAYGRLYFADTRGRFYAVDAETGERAWRRVLGAYTAASPTVGDGVVYQPLMNPLGQDRATAPGYMVALDAETGEEKWRFKAGVMESSPLLVDGVLYFGTFDDKLYALDVATAKPRWTFKAGDDIKGGPVLAGGSIIFGAYDGKMYAVDVRNGKRRWSSSAQGGLAGAGNFYATPAAAYGRVYIGNTDGKVYAFGAKSGNLLWSRSTGGYVYSSAAVWNKTVFVGSYDRNLYALDAATGDVRWKFRANERISGPATVLSEIVYFSTLGGKTYGLDARTGKQVWTFRDGRYASIVADTDRVYLTGVGKVYALEAEG